MEKGKYNILNFKLYYIIQGMRKFIDAYYLNDLKMKEEVPKIKECALMWIDYVLDGNEFDSSTTESFEARKRLINKYL